MHGRDDRTEQRVKDDAAVQVERGTDAVALRIERSDQRREPQRDADRGDEEDEKDGSAERDGGQRRGVVASEAAHHQVVGHLDENLPELGEHDRQSQFQVGLVLLLIGGKTVHDR